MRNKWRSRVLPILKIMTRNESFIFCKCVFFLLWFNRIKYTLLWCISLSLICLFIADVLHTNAYIVYVDSSCIFAVLNCLFNIHNDNAFVDIQFALTTLIPWVGLLLSLSLMYFIQMRISCALTAVVCSLSWTVCLIYTMIVRLFTYSMRWHLYIIPWVGLLLLYIDSSRIFAVLNCLFNIHNDSALLFTYSMRWHL